MSVYILYEKQNGRRECINIICISQNIDKLNTCTENYEDIQEIFDDYEFQNSMKNIELKQEKFHEYCINMSDSNANIVKCEYTYCIVDVDLDEQIRLSIMHNKEEKIDVYGSNMKLFEGNLIQLVKFIHAQT